MTVTQSKLPMVPVATAEILYVALDHVLTHVEEHGSYPKHLSEDMRRVMGTYNKLRANTLILRGGTPETVRKYTEMASRSLARWLMSRSAKHEELQGDFDRWAGELSNDRQDNHGE